MVAFTAIGLGFYGKPAVSIGAFLPGAWLYVWVTILTVSGILGLIAGLIAVRHEDTSLLIERLSLVGAGAFCLMWVLAIFLLTSFATIGGIIIFSMLAYACGWRFYQVQRRVQWKKRRNLA